MTHTSDFDIAIVGAGPAGLTLAAGLAQRWGTNAKRILVVDGKPLAQAQRDPRTLALADSTRSRLLRFGFPDSAVPIHHIHVSERGKFGRVLMRPEDASRDALGWTVRYGDLIATLDAAVAAAGVTVLRGRKVLSIDHGSECVQLHLDTQGDDASLGTPVSATLSAYLHIDAEGGVYGQAVQRDKVVDYGQQGLIATIHAKPHLQHGKTVAYERFTPEGPLALLPTANDGSVFSLVWCGSAMLTEQRLALSDNELLRAIEVELGHRVTLLAVNSRKTFPLGMNMRAELTSLRYAAVGNAAQILHPVAGQGLNLGLRDVDALSNLIVPALFEAGAPAAELQSALAKYASARGFDRQLISSITHWMVRAFSTRQPHFTLGRQAALLSMELLPGARKLFAHTMLLGV